MFGKHLSLLVRKLQNKVFNFKILLLICCVYIVQQKSDLNVFSCISDYKL